MVRRVGGDDRAADAADYGWHDDAREVMRRQFACLQEAAHADDALQGDADAVGGVGDLRRVAHHHQDGQDDVGAAARHDVDDAADDAEDADEEVVV